MFVKKKIINEVCDLVKCERKDKSSSRVSLRELLYIRSYLYLVDDVLKGKKVKNDGTYKRA